MSVFGSINVVISAAIGGLAGALQRAMAALSKFGKSVLSALNPVRLLGSVLRSTFGQLALFSGADAIVSSLKSMAGAAAENIDSMSKLSRRLGTTYGELAGIEHAGALAGVGMDKIAAAMTKSDVAMTKAAGGSKQAQAAFAKLGLNVAQLQGMSAADRFEAISAAIAGLPNEAERAAAAVAMFGRSGAELMPLFEGMKGASALASVTGDQISAAMAKSDAAMKQAVSGSKDAQAAFATLGLDMGKLQNMTAEDRFNAMADAMSRLPTEAERATVQAQAAFDTLKLDPVVLNDMTSEDRFNAISSAISKLPNEAERAAAAVALFGQSGADLMPLFDGSTNSIRAARDEAARFGLALSDNQAASVEGMNDAFTRAYRAIQGVVTQVVANLAPAVEALTTSFVNMIGSVGGTTIGETIADALMQGAVFLADTVDWLVPYMMSVWDGLVYVAGLLKVPFDIGYRTGQLFVAVGKVLQTVFTAFASGLVFIVKMLIDSAKKLASAIPGMGGVADQLGGASKSLQKTQDKLTASTAKSASEAGQAFANAWNGAKDEATTAAPGMFGQMMRDSMSRMETERKATEKKKGMAAAVSGQPIAATINSAELKAIVVGTSAGESFRNSLLRGADPRLEGEKSAARTADATERTADGIEEIADGFAATGGMALASISV